MLFVAILLVAVVPLAWRYYRDCREDALQHLATKLAFFAERGASWVDVASLPALTQPEQQTPAYQALVHTLQRMEHEFTLETAAIVRREADGRYTYVTMGHGSVAIGQAVALHTRFPAMYIATNETWIQGAMSHSQLLGGGEFDPFIQIDMPLKRHGIVVVGDTAIAGTLTHLAASMAQASLERPVAVRTNLKLVLTPRHAAGLLVVYAKVLAHASLEAVSAPTTACLGFTALAEDAKTFLAHILLRSPPGGRCPSAVRESYWGFRSNSWVGTEEEAPDPLQCDK